MPADWRGLAVLAPLAVWALLLELRLLSNNGRRASFLMASVIWGTVLTALTELLSLFDAANYRSLVSGWLVLLFPLLLLVLSEKHRRSGTRGAFDLSSHKVIILPTAAILAVTLFIAVIAPPNNFDSMTYHMPRVMHWIQNGSVAHYPTNILRQIELNPWAEYAILHLQLLSGGDYCANLVQWFSMLGCVVGVSLIAAHFSATIAGQALSGFVAATVPMAILQSSSTQNDLVVSFWLVCFVYFGLRTAKESSATMILMMSLSLGLAILTKGTAYIFALPFLLWFFIRDVKTDWRHAAMKYLLLGSVVLSLNAGHYYRNYALFQNPLNSGADTYSNSHVTIGVVTSNVVRNVAIHLMTPSAYINSRLVSTLHASFSVFGVDLDDPASTWPGRKFADFADFQMGPSEDASGNPLHLLLFLAASVLLLIRKRCSEITFFAAAIAAGFLLFCVLLRWQPWHSRLHLPLFILFAPIAGAILSEVRRDWPVPSLVTVMTAAALPWLFCNINRPIISLAALVPRYPASIVTTPRRTQYVYNRPGIEQSYLDAAAEIKARGAQNIGFKSGGNGWEYPLWVFTRTHGLDGPRIEHLDVKNVSGTLQRRPFKPDLVVRVGDDSRVIVERP